MSDVDTRAESLPSSEEYVDVIASSELEIGGQRAVMIKGRRLLLCKTDSGMYAMLDLCPHARQPIAGGPIVGNTITCPHHGACFDLDNGRPTNGVTVQSLKLLPLREANGRIAVKLPPPAGGYLAWKKT